MSENVSVNIWLHMLIIDFGVDTLVKLARETHFPWLLSNVHDVTTEQPLAEGLVSHVVTCQGRKVSLTFVDLWATWPNLFLFQLKLS